MKFELKEYNINVPETELIADVISVSKITGKDTVTQSDYSKHGKYHSSTIQRRFKSWFIVLEKAGLEPARSPFNISEEELFKNIATVWIKLGQQPVNKDMKAPISKYGGTTYIRHFGTWMEALRKFIDYENAEFKEEEQIVQEKLIEEIEEKAAELQLIQNSTRSISLRLRFSVFLRDGFRCTSCGKSPVTHPGVVLHCDHILPWSKGGKTNMDNLKTLCSNCNLGKGNMPETK
ncbi:MAG: homing endonuclease associated repeat-containing protein [Mucilaginibacter sp.]|uniref:homing endonuclease associated repeat-containing protein n=1 Tax=Mucilaginibacter sp. TaxID=1882438 RepID=UPI0034E42DD2